MFVQQPNDQVSLIEEFTQELRNVTGHRESLDQRVLMLVNCRFVLCRQMQTSVLPTRTTAITSPTVPTRPVVSRASVLEATSATEHIAYVTYCVLLCYSPQTYVTSRWNLSVVKVLGELFRHKPRHMSPGV